MEGGVLLVDFFNQRKRLDFLEEGLNKWLDESLGLGNFLPVVKEWVYFPHVHQTLC